ncbi:MAG TPA: Uma2 family endonuclease [Pyrinomonadaceae bacterium]|jgi:Uma2 family endonuclease|nr:Uma2 family endonuclease [Pyrinomonadaceae bacterium]
MSTKTEATIEDLYRIDGKAEIVNGEIVLMAPTGFMPSHAGGEIFASLREYARRTRSGYAIPDNAGFIVNLPNRRSFSPDVAFYTGEPTAGKFMNSAPVFAVEVRSEGDYGPRMESRMAEKRADYFAAGTLVVWDVDVLKEKLVRVYRASEPERAQIYRRGEVAEAEPAVPGWTMPVDDLFIENDE